MRASKFLIATFAAAGIAGLFLPRDAEPSVFDYWLATHALQLVIVVAMFAVPLLAALIAMIRPPFTRWHAIAALPGFILALVKTQVWNIGIGITDQTLALQLLIAAAGGGALVSLVGFVKPDATS